MNKLSLTGANFGSDRETFMDCDCFGIDRFSISALFGLTISHCTRILYIQKRNKFPNKKTIFLCFMDQTFVMLVYPDQV